MVDKEVAAILVKLNANRLTYVKQINALDFQIKNLEPGKELKNKISQRKLLKENLKNIDQDIKRYK